ncbi:MAG: alpha/beta hydrolase [Gammaproteobacteria bacterium]|nr:alpha/beta hydrolase [Gammaproteobacteria bacterium]
MVLVHGLGTKASVSWDPISDELAKHYHIVTFDLPGFGQSLGELGVPPSLESYSALVMRIVSEYAKSKIIFVGHSMGAAIGLRFVSQYPHLVDKAVFMDAAGILEKAAYLKFLTRMERNTPVKSLFAGLSNILSDVAVEIFDGFSNIEVIKGLMHKNTDVNIAINLIETDFTNDIENIRAKTLIIWGAKDLTAPPRTGKMLNFHLMRSKLVVLPEAGHIPHIKTPNKVAEIIQQWLESPKLDEYQFPELGDQSFYCKTKELKEPMSGSFGALVFKGCSNIQLKNLSARSIQLEDSVATFDNVKIVSDQVGLTTSESSVLATNLVIEAPLGIQSKGSKLDLAGAIINYTTAPIKGSNSLVYWSTSFQTQNGQLTKTIHKKQIVRK